VLKKHHNALNATKINAVNATILLKLFFVILVIILTAKLVLKVQKIAQNAMILIKKEGNAKNALKRVMHL
jgi:hypothetical protein